MISKKKLTTYLRWALDNADPNQVKYPAIKRERITYPMKNFTHALKDVVSTYPQFKEVRFRFDDDTVSKELTVCILKTGSGRVKMTYDYKTDTVIVTAIGADTDVTTETVSVDKLVETVGKYVPKAIKKKVVIKIKRKTT